MATVDFLAEVTTRDGAVAADRLTARLRVTKIELARAFGLSGDAVSKSARLKTPATQRRLRDGVEIINRVLPPGIARSRCRHSATARRKTS
jgi:hypothetical protein